ncbi:hypothetical protein GCM10008904_29130 [Paraclostridium ghonii]|uniref:DUF4276 family protein n=1 Tax=Paraclostridium ghonii TaxID=29358 RepID=A0ABU0MXR3_9FIRM|nr:DUF3226 domain-containing protein [Paeniclostridium ghonii]MDQ0555682.1 hypothetical protein [Paeniclostridium ghonii]
MKNILFFVEGVHDANCIAKILDLNNFKEIRTIDKLPDIWKRKIPRTYPFVKDRIERCVPIPSYFTNQKVIVVIICANGEGRLIKEIDLYISNMSKSELNQIKSICAIFDADQKLAKETFDEKFKNNKKDMIIYKKDFLNEIINIKGEQINLYNYFFPDNNRKGTLENLLLDGANVVYKDLLEQVDNYIENIDEKHKYNWSISSENKVRVGCIANVFQPGSANQSSIRHDDWISEESISYSEDIKKFYEFVINIINF